MTAVEKIVALANSEVGYHEKASNASLDDKTANSGTGNYTKYARDLDAIPNFYNGKKNGYAWCDIFVDWLFVKCFGAALAMQMLYQPTYSAGAGCLYSAQYYKQNGAFNNIPEVGNQIFFSYSTGEVSHTGIVVAVDGNTVTTVEGNSSDGTYRRTYNRNIGSIYGYGKPNYALAGNVDESAEQATGEAQTPVTPSTPVTPVTGTMVTVELPLLKKGAINDSVEAVQTLLEHWGYSCGRWGIDGDFGNDTEAAVKEFQTQHYLTADGEVGNMTYKALFGLFS